VLSDLILAGLDPREPSYIAQATNRITTSCARAEDVLAAIDAVPIASRPMVESLVVMSFAQWIAARHQVQRSAVYARVPAQLMERVRSNVQRLERLAKRGAE